MTLIIMFTAVLCFGYVALFIFFRIAWSSIPITDMPEGADSIPIIAQDITVIIPARNEEANIAKCLDSIIAQHYPFLQVIVVDDHSTDNTAEIVTTYKDRKVELIMLADHVSGEINSYKKKAIEIAVSQATGKLIVHTDADCIVPEGWLYKFSERATFKSSVFIAAPVLISPANSFISIFQALDFMTLQGITGAAVERKMMSMCNGANMAYSKTAFEAVNGYEGIDDIASGDDMLLMYKIEKKFPGSATYLKSRESIVETAPVADLKGFLRQRIRWASKSDKYNDKRILPVLMLVYFFNVMMFMLPIITVFNNDLHGFLSSYSVIECWFILLFIKTFFELIFLYPVANFFNRRSLLLFFPAMQPFHILYTVLAGWLGKFGRFTWKDRKVK